MHAGRVALAGAALAALTLAGGGQVASASGVAASPVTTSPAAVREYWTPARMRAARPADLVVGADGKLSRARQPLSTDASAGSSGLPDRLHGKVFFTINGGSEPGDYVCSGTAVTSNLHTLAWTAGHCVDDSEFGGGFAVNWTFVPGYRNGDEPFGEWAATRLLTTDEWRGDADIREDFGAARLARNRQGQGVEDVVGARPIDFRRSRTQQYRAFGYPAEPSIFNPTFDGQRLFTCDSAATGTDNPPGNGPLTVQIDCDMSGGSSGGGWVNSDGAVNGLTSYGYQLDLGHLYGPYFGADAEDFYRQASGKPLRCGGTDVTNLGGAGPDSFSGGETADVFKVGGDADTARGLGGDDVACGGGAGDKLKGGSGNDVLRGGPGRDVLNGGPGDDLCIGGAGRDRAPGCERRRGIP